MKEQMDLTLFPKKPYPEDCNEGAASIAKAIVFLGLLAGLWSGYHLLNFARSSSFGETRGTMNYGALEYVVTRVSNASYSYMVDGREFTSQNIVFGGRPMGVIEREGPVIVYYDKANPAIAVLHRRPAEVVVFAFLFALISPFAGRFIWVMYV